MFPIPKAPSATRNPSVTLIGHAAASHGSRERVCAPVPIGTLGLLSSTSFQIVPPNDMTISLQDHSLRASHLWRRHNRCDIVWNLIWHRYAEISPQLLIFGIAL
jgi:hypothetical protein